MERWNAQDMQDVADDTKALMEAIDRYVKARIEAAIANYGICCYEPPERVGPYAIEEARTAKLDMGVAIRHALRERGWR